MHLKWLVYGLVGIGLCAFIFKKFKPFGSRDEEIERRRPGRAKESPLLDRRKDDDVGGED